MKVFRGVLVLGRIAAANVATFHAKSEVNPGVTRFQTLFTAGSVRGDFMDVGEMRAGRRHDFAPLSRVCPAKRSDECREKCASGAAKRPKRDPSLRGLHSG
jgi:hypothetical protein